MTGVPSLLRFSSVPSLGAPAVSVGEAGGESVGDASVDVGVEVGEDEAEPVSVGLPVPLAVAPVDDELEQADTDSAVATRQATDRRDGVK